MGAYDTAPGVATPEAADSSLPETGLDWRGKNIVAEANANASVRKRRAHHNSRRKRRARAVGPLVANWLVPLAHRFGISKHGYSEAGGIIDPRPAPWGSTPSRAALLTQHAEWRARGGDRGDCWSDPERQDLWRKTLAALGCDAARADVVLTARLQRPPTRDAIKRHNWTVARALVAWEWPRCLQGRPTDLNALFAQSRDDDTSPRIRPSISNTPTPDVHAKGMARGCYVTGPASNWRDAPRGHSRFPLRGSPRVKIAFQPLSAPWLTSATPWSPRAVALSPARQVHLAPEQREPPAMDAYRRGVTVLSDISYHARNRLPPLGRVA